jgi:orotate phosphoribosyltransferase
MEIQDILKETGAYLQGHFELTSGRHSEFYVEKIKIINNPYYVSKICEQIANICKDYECDIVVGPAFGGIVLAYEVAKNLGKKFVFSQRKDEQMVIRSGFEVEPKSKAIIIEDIVTTGGSVKEVIKVLESLDVEIKAIACIVDRSGGKAEFGKYDFLSLMKMNIETFEPVDCPLCKKGIPIQKPGASSKK